MAVDISEGVRGALPVRRPDLWTPTNWHDWRTDLRLFSSTLEEDEEARRGGEGDPEGGAVEKADQASGTSRSSADSGGFGLWR